MEQYIEYIRQTIIETVTNTQDESTLQLIYDLLMSTTQEECSSTS